MLGLRSQLEAMTGEKAALASRNAILEKVFTMRAHLDASVGAPFSLEQSAPVLELCPPALRMLAHLCRQDSVSVTGVIELRVSSLHDATAAARSRSLAQERLGSSLGQFAIENSALP